MKTRCTILTLCTESTEIVHFTINISRLQLHRLNWPDFLLYEAANATLWRKIETFGPETVHKLADEIRLKSTKLSKECLDFPSGNDTKVTRPAVKADKSEDVMCRRLAFQGTHTTKLFQVNQINKILKSEPNYNFWNGFYL